MVVLGSWAELSEDKLEGWRAALAPNFDDAKLKMGY